MLQSIQHESSFSPSGFISSFTEFLSEGTLCIPGFVNTLQTGDTVNMRTLKPETGGLSKQAFIDFKKGINIRTNDPFHSFFIYGKNAAKYNELTQNNTETFGHDSMFGQLHRDHAILILIDLDLYYGFTFAHYAEQELKVPYRKNQSYTFEFTNVKGESSQNQFTVYAKRRGYNPVLNSLEPLLLSSGAMIKTVINGIPVKRIELSKAFTVIESDVKHNNARNLINFSVSLYLKQLIKNITG